MFGMMRGQVIAMTSVLTLLLGSGASRADCSTLVTQFDAAVAARSLNEAVSLEKQIYNDDVCNAKDAEVQNRLLKLQIGLAADPKAPDAVRTAELAGIRKSSARLHSWSDTLGLADGLLKLRRFGDAEEFYDKAISLAGSDAQISDRQKSDVLKKASAAKILANNDDQGRITPTFLNTSRDIDGALGGLYAPSMRGVEVVAVPLPINFVVNSTNMTPNGEKAAAELLEALKQQNVSEITLIGHTDARGPDDYNLKLSEARVQSVAEYLVQHGLNVRVTAIGKGWHQPFDTSVLPYRPSQEEIWALDRRVELLR